MAHRLPVDSNSFCKSNPKRNRCQDRIRAVPGEDRRASQILANLGQTSPLFFFAIFFDLRDAENEGLVVVQSQEVILLVHLIRDAMYDLQNWNTSRWEDERGGGESGNDRLSGSI